MSLVEKKKKMKRVLSNVRKSCTHTCRVLGCFHL